MSNLFRDNLYNEFPDPNKKIEEIGSALDDNTAKLQRFISILDFKPDGNVNGIADTKAFKDAIAYADNIAQTVGVLATPIILVPSLGANKKYYINETLYKPLYVKLLPIGNVNLRYMGTGVFMHHRNTSAVTAFRSGYDQMPFNIGDGGDLGKFYIQGNGKASGQTAFKFGEDTLQALHETHTAWSYWRNMYVEKFQTGFSFTGIQTYIMRFDNITFSNCGTIVKDLNQANNAGEAVNWHNCGFHNSDLFLEVNYEINHSFSDCSIDYNAAGVKLNGAGYRRLTFTNGCWIEASNTPEVNPFILATGGTAKNNHVTIEASKIYPTNKTADILFKGAMTLAVQNVTVEVNRYNNGNLGAGAMLCDDNVVIANGAGLMFHDNPMVLSRKQALNRNSDFEIDAAGVTTVTGFTKTSGAAIAVDATRAFSGTKSIKIAAGATNWVDFETEVVPLRGADRVLGQARLWLPISRAKANITTVVTFYAEDKTTVLDTVTLAQNMDYTASGGGGKWYALLTGTSASPYTVPPLATHCKYKITVGSIGTTVGTDDIWLDDMVITKM